MTRIADLLPQGSLVLVEGGAAASVALPGLVRDTDHLTFTGIVVPGVNRMPWLANPTARFETFFMTPELAEAGDRVDFLPLAYSDIRRRLSSRAIDAALFSVAPPDADGMCSFGPTVDFIADLWRDIPVRIAHINPLMPRTSGHPGIPRDAFHAAVEAPQPLTEVDDGAPDPRTATIAANVAAFIGDGATVQVGIGTLPGAVLRALRDRRDLSIHSGLIGDGAIDLLDSGAVPGGERIVTGLAIGTRRLYDALPGSGIRFAPVAHTHDWATIARHRDFVAVNSAMEVDLFGQGYSERTAGGWNSGTGGATDFARGAALGGGLRILALPASARAASRIVPAGTGRGPATLSRTDTDIVVTEHGAADLRGLSHDARAAALIAIAAPAHREDLARSWRTG
ncbi:hypothetical protein ASG29_04205 [Sphingomonas sp. Leaf412]|uniref:acetyl-CoA hydrolase/transferase family protein n=1 Tax=Sphingomonas sp. Leaf412 TaxID=1736370 RepID=UPI0006F45EE9|nr:acetyl-CoA hydrolase/transferase C-terminal domain-containing protein [Sphingomonas sp. Leaf412]KQT35308.1 hypothetical protein ASG29_04205 [Sphingomonas sp. Leaf412]